MQLMDKRIVERLIREYENKLFHFEAITMNFTYHTRCKERYGVKINNYIFSLRGIMGFIMDEVEGYDFYDERIKKMHKDLETTISQFYLDQHFTLKRYRKVIKESNAFLKVLKIGVVRS